MKSCYTYYERDIGVRKKDEEMLNSFSGVERRRYPRLEIELALQYREIGDFERLPQESVARNISEGGISFRVDRFLPLGNRLITSLSLEPHSEILKTVVKIVWIQKDPHADSYDIGCQFINISEEGRRRLQRFLMYRFSS